MPKSGNSNGKGASGRNGLGSGKGGNAGKGRGPSGGRPGNGPRSAPGKGSAPAGITKTQRAAPGKRDLPNRSVVQKGIQTRTLDTQRAPPSTFKGSGSPKPQNVSVVNKGITPQRNTIGDLSQTYGKGTPQKGQVVTKGSHPQKGIIGDMAQGYGKGAKPAQPAKNVQVVTKGIHPQQNTIGDLSQGYGKGPKRQSSIVSNPNPPRPGQAGGKPTRVGLSGPSSTLRSPNERKMTPVTYSAPGVANLTDFQRRAPQPQPQKQVADRVPQAPAPVRQPTLTKPAPVSPMAGQGEPAYRQDYKISTNGDTVTPQRMQQLTNRVGLDAKKRNSSPKPVQTAGVRPAPTINPYRPSTTVSPTSAPPTSQTQPVHVADAPDVTALPGTPAIPSPGTQPVRQPIRQTPVRPGSIYEADLPTPGIVDRIADYIPNKLRKAQMDYLAPADAFFGSIGFTNPRLPVRNSGSGGSGIATPSNQLALVALLEKLKQQQEQQQAQTTGSANQLAQILNTFS